MSYHRGFGMRSFENIVRDGRFRTPANTQWVIGAPVMADPATPGVLKAATAGLAPNGAAGLVLYEHIQLQNMGDPALYGEGDLWYVPAGRYAQMVHGAGAKVWFINTADKTLYDGRLQPAVKLLANSVDVSTLAPGAGLTPDGAGKYKVSSGTDGVWLTVEQVNPSNGRVEARFVF